ncbi:MAG: acylphosphatase [Lentimicrobium sp.]|nr:acylphosphatase [Lentimicrobium sp.]
MKALRIKITGDLFRKGYRYLAIQQATELNLSGFIQYLKTGNGVYIHVQGDEEALLRFVDWCSFGNHGCTIDSIGSEVTGVGYFRGFLIATSSYELTGGRFTGEKPEEVEPAVQDNSSGLHPLKVGMKWLRTAFY